MAIGGSLKWAAVVAVESVLRSADDSIRRRLNYNATNQLKLGRQLALENGLDEFIPRLDSLELRIGN